MADRDEFDGFVAARPAALLRTAYLLTGDWALGEDLLQTAQAKSWFAWRRIDGAPEPYVRRVIATTYATWWRRRWKRGTRRPRCRRPPALPAPASWTTGTCCGGCSARSPGGSGP